ncbi:MAG: hypothetical protein KAX49_05940 [Halanaerobiales bacterium]|nr:hypothetical protein [Halanaerobiales bacterium]
MLDFYFKGDQIEEIKNRIRLSSEDTVMLAIYFELDKEDIVDEFLMVLKLLKLG